MYEAARRDDNISHSNALLGFLAGAVLGCLLIGAVAFLSVVAIGTCGFGAILLAGVLGLAANVAAHGLLEAGEAIGGMFTNTAGKIVQGSPNVFINFRPAAYVTDEIQCDKHSGKQKIAQGSTNVFINYQHASRKGDKTTCDGKIETGSNNVFIGGDTGTYLDITPEVPDSYRKYTEWAFTAAAFVGGLAGVVQAAERGALSCALRFAASFVVGEVAGRYVFSPIISGIRNHVINPIVSGILGHPVNVMTGRKLLINEDETDFSLPGLLPITSSRFYSSGLTHEGMIGRGWLHEWDIFLRFTQNQIIYTPPSGRAVPFPRTAPNQGVFLPAEQITLAPTPDGRHIVYGQDEIYYVFGPMLPDGTARLIAIEDQVGRRIEFQRDGFGRLQTVSGGGQKLRLQYGAANSVIRIELVEGGTPRTLVSYGYDGYNRLTTVTDQSGRVVRRFTYEGYTTLMASHSDALGFTCGYRWETMDGQPRVTEERSSEGERYRFIYDTKNRQTWVQDTFGNQAHWRYDERAHVIENTWFDGRTTRFDFDGNDNLIKMYLPGDRIVSLAYDEKSRLVAETDPLGRVTRSEYDGESLRVKRQTMPDGAQWEAQYDYRGLLLSTRDPLGRETQYDYGADGLPDIIVDPNGGENRIEWNKLGQITAYSDSEGKTTRYEYDADGNLIAVIDAEAKRTAIQRNGDGVTTQVMRPDGSHEQFEYLPAGLMSSHRDASGKAREWEYNTRGQTTRVISPAQRSVTFHYDQHGRLIQLANGNGSSMQFNYDAGNRLMSEIGFDRIEKHYRYDGAGFLVAVKTHGYDEARNVLKREVSFERDAVGRLIARHTKTASTTYEYDSLNRLLSATRTPTDAGKAMGIVSDTVKFEYDAAGQVIAEEGANGCLRYTLDEMGNVITLTLPQGQELKMLHTTSGHVRQLRIGDAVISDFERDHLYREVMRTQGRLNTTFIFDELGRRTWQSTNLTETRGVLDQAQIWRTYRYDKTGEIVEQNDRRRGRQEFRYDDEGFLLSRTHQQGLESFTWDDSGNLTLSKLDASGLYNPRVAGDRLKIWQDIRLTYDAFGNVLTKKKGPWFEQHFEYDAEDRLIAVHSNTRQDSTTTRFSYDAIGRRIGKTVREVGRTDSVIQSEIRFVWRGWRMVQEQCDGELRSYIHVHRSHTPTAYLAQKLQNNGTAEEGRLYYFHTDQIGTPLEVTDATGTLVWSGHYSAWGKLLRADLLPDTSTTSFTQNLRYQGQYADESTGLHYNTFRYYDPDIGRFTTQDPIGLSGGTNFYQYGPNPTRWIDPLGSAGFIFRGDDSYKGGPIGQPIQGDVTAQDIFDHVNENGNGTLKSFSERLGAPGERGGAGFFTSEGNAVKVSNDSIASLKASGQIRTFTPEEARDILKADASRKLRKAAGDIFQAMKKNNEVLVQGQIPEEHIERVKMKRSGGPRC